MKTAWMWDAEHQIYGREIYGLNIDLEQSELHWFQGNTCSMCGDDHGYLIQTISEFRSFGPPPNIGTPPADVTKGLNDAIQKITGNS